MLLELLANLVNDLSPVKSKYLQFGVQLGISMDEINSFAMERNHDPEAIMHQILHYLLSNTPENICIKTICIALERIGRKDLTSVVKQKYLEQPLQGSLLKYFMVVLNKMNTESLLGLTHRYVQCI